MGKPTDEDTYYGPIARTDLRDELHGQFWNKAVGWF
jgi:succinate-semialdehyde dehydrogenase/glutarate-semialdehyde dehydrogenase